MNRFRQMVVRLFALALFLTLVGGPVLAQAVPKIAVIDVVRLLEESSEGKKGIEGLKALQQQRTEDGKLRQDKVKDLREQIANGRLSLSEDRLAELQREMEDGLIELRRFEDDATRELQEGQAKMLQEIQKRLMPVISAVGAEFGYTLIFNKFESGLVYASEAIDITELVLERFDASTATDAGSGG